VNAAPRNRTIPSTAHQLISHVTGRRNISAKAAKPSVFGGILAPALIAEYAASLAQCVTEYEYQYAKATNEKNDSIIPLSVAAMGQ